MDLSQLIDVLKLGRDLTTAESTAAVTLLVDPAISAETKADFLTALAQKGETIEEIQAFASELRRHSVVVPNLNHRDSTEILDVCGTGGDHLNTFNISTTVALTAAAAGVVVAKHGNRAITSQSGSADVLERLGIPIHLTPTDAAEQLWSKKFAFFFAPSFHPAFKHIGPARKLCAARGQRTIFNFLGPLLNPARPTVQLVGVPQPALCEKLAKVLQGLGLRRAMVVCGSIGDRHLDELSTLGPTHVAEFYQDRGFTTSAFIPSDYPLQPATLQDLSGASGDESARIVERVLRGEDRGPRRDAVLLNTGAALMVAGKTKSIAEGWNVAEEILDSGKAWGKVEELRRGGSLHP